jgi:hypothetical protein
MDKVIGVNYLPSIIDHREIVRPSYYSKMPMIQSNGILSYARIQKNAHQSLKSFFHELGFNNLYNNTDQIKNNEEVIVVLRDPLERWISGLSQYFIVRVPNLALQFDKKENLNIAYDIIKLCIDNTVMDLHTETQISFLHGFKLNQCVFFKLDKNLEFNLCTFLETKLKREVNIKLPSLNQSINNNMKLKIQMTIKEFLDKNKTEKDNLINALIRDYQLIKDVSFVSYE